MKALFLIPSAERGVLPLGSSYPQALSIFKQTKCSYSLFFV